MASKNGLVRCPNCGSSYIKQDTEAGKLRCENCRTLFEGELANKAGGIRGHKGEDCGLGAEDLIPGKDVVVTMACPSCGAQVVVNTDEATSVKCHWCRHVLSINEQVSNGAVPDLVLPFKISKRKAQAAITDYISNHVTVVNKDFKDNYKPELVCGVYFPYMIVDVNSKANMSGYAERSSDGKNLPKNGVWLADVYSVVRNFDLLVDDLTVESSSRRLNQDTMINANYVINTIMPFDTENAVAWDPRYLRGYTSERRDLNIDELDRKAKNQTEDIMKYRIMDSIIQYDRGVCWDIMRLNQKGVKWQTAYLPVWLFSVGVKKGDRTILHYIAVNARTGETHGSVPVDMNKIIKLILGVPLALMLLNLIQSFFELYMFGFKASFALLFRPLVPIISIIWMMMTGIISIVKWRKYGDFDVRHDFETETRAKIDKLEESDELVEALHGLKNSQMRNRNDNKKTDVDGSKKRTIDGRNNSNHNLTILIIVGVIFFMMFILPFLVFMSVLLASY